MMKRERKFFIKVSLFVYGIWFIFFDGVGRYAATLPTRDITSSIDPHIPLIPEFIWIYILCYIFPFLPLFVIKDWRRFNRALLGIIIANLSAFIVYLIFPVAFPRPELGQSPSERLLSFIYIADFCPGANKLPSLHIIFTWIVYLASRRQRLNKFGDSIVFFTAVMITISTLFVKQHIIVDVVAGLFWAFSSWTLAGYIYNLLAGAHMEARAGFEQIMKKLYPGFIFYSALVFSVIWFQ